MAEVAVGKDGFLFAKSDGNNLLRQLKGEIEPSSQEIAAIMISHLNRLAVSELLGVRYLWLVCPAKERVLVDFLPDDMKLGIDLERSPLTRFESESSRLLPTSSASRLIYSLERAFDGVSSKERLFHKTDSHWTHLGAYITYKYIVDSILGGAVGPSIKHFKSVSANQQGDLGRIAGHGPEPITYMSSGGDNLKKLFSNKIENNGKFEIYEGDNSELPTAIIYHSSSIDYMKSFILKHFSRVMMFFSADINMNVVINEKPDFVMHMQQERYLLRAPHDKKPFLLSRSISEKDPENNATKALNEYIVDGGYFLNPRSKLRTLDLFNASDI
jgi:hypothetical protein